MSARDVIEQSNEFRLACEQAMRSPLVVADHIVRDLETAGYMILSPDEVWGIRDEALEEAAWEAKSWEQTARKLSRRESDKERSLYHSLAGDMARDVAAAIRSLKGGRDVT